MELQLTNCDDIELDENCEYIIPGYMTRLAPEEISRAVAAEHIIIATGSDPVDGKITIITLKGKVMIFNAREFYIPDGPAIPVNGGIEIFLENVSGRWPGAASGFYVDSKWIIEKSTSALVGATIDIKR